MLAVLAIGEPAAAQPQTYQQKWASHLDAIAVLRARAPDGQADAIAEQVDIKGNLAGFALFAYSQSLARELRLSEDARTDKQIGAPAGANGSTSLVSKGGVPAILGFAVEYGALTQTADQTSVTLRGNGIGWLDLLKGQNVIEAYQDDSRFVRQLRRISYSLTYGVASTAAADRAERPDPDQIAASADEGGQQLKSYSVRVNLIDRRDPRSAENRASAARLMQVNGRQLNEALTFFLPVLKSADYQRWLDESGIALRAPVRMSRGELERVFYARLEVLRQLMISRIPDFDNSVARLVTTLEEFEDARTGWFDKLQERFVLATEFVRDRQAEQPGSWTGRIIGEGRLGAKWDLTANFAATRQDKGTAMVPAAVNTRGWRDVQMAVQAERPLGSPGDPCLPVGGASGRPVLSFEYLGRWLTDKAVVRFAGHDFSVAEGWIHAAQAKITIPLKGSGAKIPLSVSYANRTELIKEKSVRAHFGITFDLDVVTSAVRP